MGPDFICIGAQRSGTTWLHRMLSMHPNIWMTPIKELHFFDDPDRSRYFKHLLKRCKSTGLMLTKWDLRYFFSGKPSDQWYSSLFADAQQRGLIAGEVTPDYAVMNENQFIRLRAMNPDVKLIFIMRDPIERSWSRYINAKRKGRENDGNMSHHMSNIKFSASHGMVTRSKYIETIDVIERHFPADQIFYGFYDDLSERPQWFAEQILMFLGVDASMASTIIPDHNVNPAAKGMPVPREFELALAPHLLPGLERLAARFDSYPTSWRDRLRSVLAMNE